VEYASPVSRRRSDFWIALDEEVVDFMRVILAVLFLVVASGSQALAKIQFCNKFQHPIFIALAYQQNGGWVTDGWIQVDTDKCLIDSNHPDLTSFYYYGETNVFDKKRWTWGNKKEFSVRDDDGFTLRNADTQQPGARFVKFSGPNTYKLPETVVQLEFESDLSTTFVVPREDNGGSATAADTARDDCENKSGDAAIAGCTILISNNPNDAVAYLDRGIEYANKHDYDRAIADYSQAIAVRPDYANAYNSRGSSFYDGKDDYSHAIADYTKAIDLNPQFAAAFVNRGNVYRFIHAYAVALKDLNAAIGLNAKSNLAFYYRAEVYEGLGRKDDAISDYRQALAVAPSDQDSKDALKRLGINP
jgi:tetratricopeptide (TPR) repeat protein